MKRYLQIAYAIEIGSALGIFLTLLLPWEQTYGSGVQVLRRAIESKIAFGLDPFNPDYIPVSYWWLLWVIPLVSLAFAMRGIVGFFDADLQHPRLILIALQLAQVLCLGWFMAGFTPTLQAGFWLASICSLILAITVLVEISLPYKSPEQLYLENLPPDHPDRIAAGASRPCKICGAYNKSDERTCRNCGNMILPEHAL